MKLGPPVARLTLRGLPECRRDGRLGTPQELGLPDSDSDEAAAREPACAARSGARDGGGLKAQTAKGAKGTGRLFGKALKKVGRVFNP